MQSPAEFPGKNFLGIFKICSGKSRQWENVFLYAVALALFFFWDSLQYAVAAFEDLGIFLKAAAALDFAESI